MTAEQPGDLPVRWPRSKIHRVLSGAAVIAVLLGTGAYVLLRHSTSGDTDSGVAVCKTLLSISTSHGADTNPSGADIRRYGTGFAASRFGDLRTAGKTYVDSYLRLEKAMTDDGTTSQTFLTAADNTTSSSQALDAACAMHGVSLVGTGDTAETEGCESGGPFLKRSDASMFSDQLNAVALKADASAAIAELIKDIGTTADPQAEADLRLTLADYRKLLADASSATASSGDLQQDRSRIAIDAGNFEDDCDADS